MNDVDIQRLLEDAVDYDSLEERDGFYYQTNESEPYSGWVKEGAYDSGKKRELFQVKDGKQDGLQMSWHENGEKHGEGTFKDGKQDGLWTFWWENSGPKCSEETFKDGELVSGKYWNSKGEEVETEEIKLIQFCDDGTAFVAQE